MRRSSFQRFLARTCTTSVLAEQINYKENRLMGMLSGRVAIVTGGGMGLGRAHCLNLASQGATVIIVDPGVALDGADSDAVPANAVAEEIGALGQKAHAVALSVTDYEGVGTLIQDVVAEHGRLDIVVNNAGITRDRMLTSMDERDWDDVIAVHLKGTFNLTKHAGTHWRFRAKAGGEVSGRIINTTSGAGMRGNPGQAAYGSAKAAIAALTTISAMELANYGVTVNAIAPVARTRMTDAVGGFTADPEPGTFDPYAPENSSPVVAYLASEMASWITGQVIRIDGNQLRFYNRWAISEQAFRPSEDRSLDPEEIDVALKSLYGVYPLGLSDRRLKLNA
jgi:NAD(P)-dependent dehydrogenase (short-subunit alcohol dehydrogenase family)